MIEENGSGMYMKGKSKHLFWPMLGCLLIIPIYLLLFPAIHLPYDYFIPNLISDLILISLLILYGVGTKIDSYRAVLLVLAGLTLINLAIYSLVRIGIHVSYITVGGSTETGGWTTSFSALEFIEPITWIVCMIIIMKNKTTGKTLWWAAVLVIIHYTFLLCFSTINIFYLVRAIHDNEKVRMIWQLLSVAGLFLHVSITAFFFGAMSFSKASSLVTHRASGIERLN